MAPKIYTKTGDSGETSLVGGQRVSKAHLRIEAYGTVDELNSVLGVARAQIDVLSSRSNLENFCQQMQTWLQMVQNQLFTIGSHLACVDEKSQKNIPVLADQIVDQLEQIIDQCEQHLPPIKQFILPGGGQVAAFLHLARTICRRAERNCIAASEHENESTVPIDGTIPRYLNRLSDLLFVWARYANQQQGFEDITWKK